MVFKHFNVVSIVAALAISNGVTYYVCQQKTTSVAAASKSKVLLPKVITAESCEFKVERLKGYKYIKPLLYGDKLYQSNRLTNLKKELEDVLLQYKQSGSITDASIYIRDYKAGDWIGINEEMGYNPGSLIKVPILITFLKMNEDQQGVLDKTVLFDKPFANVPIQTYNSNQIQLGRTYTIRELLKYMVSYSDNNATYILNTLVDIPKFNTLFTDLGLKQPNIHDINFTISSKDYSAFLKVIYNAGYLTISDSEFAAELMSKCDFKEGFANGLPSDVEMIHKFGEAGNASSHQLHESGLIYVGSRPYLLTVMTKGKDIKQLPAVISAIAKLSYTTFSEQSAEL